jgi:uncharacterized protein YdgA (DUF945 family)
VHHANAAFRTALDGKRIGHTSRRPKCKGALIALWIGCRHFYNPIFSIMKKKIPLVIVVLAILWLGTTWLSGKYIETQINDGIADTNQIWAKTNPQIRPRIKPISYERGLFSTHARYALTSNALPSNQEPEIDLTIWHGPFPRGLAFKKFVLHAELVPVGTIKTLADSLTNGKPPLVIDTRCSYGNYCTGTGHVPAIEFAPSNKIKLAFGGVQMQFDIDQHSETDYKTNGSAQFLPLSINGQNFGSGQWTIASSNAQNVTETLFWKTDQGQSKLTLAGTLTRPLSRAEIVALAPQNMSEFFDKLIKTASFNMSLSKPMIVDLRARALNITQGTDLAVARQQASAQLDATLVNAPQVGSFIRVQDDAITSDWQYTDGKLTINGQENPELLALIKQIFKIRLGNATAQNNAE